MPRSSAGSIERLFSLLLRVTLALAIVCMAVKAWSYVRHPAHVKAGATSRRPG